jgi:MFS family permease
MRFTVLFLAGAIATFPLFVPPFFLPLYAASLGLSASAGAGLVAGFNFSSAVGRLCCGLLSDFMGPVNTLLLSLILSALSMLVLWPVSNSLGPLIVFVIINGAANGGFFSTMPTVVGSVFGSRRVGVAMGMIVSGWAGGYLMVRFIWVSWKLSINSDRYRVLRLLDIFWLHMEVNTARWKLIILLSSMLDPWLLVLLSLSVWWRSC